MDAKMGARLQGLMIGVFLMVTAYASAGWIDSQRKAHNQAEINKSIYDAIKSVNDDVEKLRQEIKKNANERLHTVR